MASSSSSTPSSSQTPKKYDVFISFRGEDTRNNFISHLHEALLRNHIETYIDYRLEKGEEVWPSLEKAIQDSTLFLVIFSENYASSTWCLTELSKILECSKNEAHLVVMPVFYRVDPSHVRKQSGSYQKAFEEHELKSINKQQLKDWREALTHAANLSGWHCSFNRNEAKLITKIVKCVIQKLDCKYQSEDDQKDFIGIHKRMADIESLLYKGSTNDVRFIGIWGMGGIGKTTLARTLYNKLHLAYDGSCFLDVREESKNIDALKKKLILTLLGDKKSQIGMLDAISPCAMRRMSRKKSFIVLDDVDDYEQLENLARRHDWFGPGSKILITTRDKQVLSKKVDDIYRLEALNSDEAFQLFSWNAFNKDFGDPEIRRLAESVTYYAGGNPLALKVLGSFLYDKNQEEWQSQLQKLKKLANPRINGILKLSWEGLDYEEKNIFLDIACFFDNYYVEDVENLLDTCGYSSIIGLKSLRDKALLDVYEGRISMHHLIKEMGQQIVREESLNDPKRRSRLWNPNEIFDILREDKGSKAIEGITLDISEVEDMCLSPQAFCSMPNLKFLIFHRSRNDQVGNKLKLPCGIEFLSNKLRLLHWEEYPLKSLPAAFKAEYLVDIGMPNSNLTNFWDGVQNLVNLRKVDLGGSKDLIELPDFSKAIHLAEVNLNDCSKLQTVHPSILSLHSLRRLWLRQCKALTCLASNTHLKSLIDLDLEECSGLNKFSVTSENSGFELKLSGTAIDDELCSSSGHLSKINSLSLNGCQSVTNLPNKLVDLRNLRHLYAKSCNMLASNLRSMVDEIRALEILWLMDCSELFKVPDNISQLSSLYVLNLSRTNIETLPLSIKHLSSLRRLFLNECGRLRSVPELPPSIFNLATNNCPSLGTLHSPLTNEDGERKQVDYRGGDDRYRYGQCPYFGFTNCMKLDGQSIKDAEAKFLLEINKSIYEWAFLEYSGDRIPEWFMYKSTQCCVTMDLSSIPQPCDGTVIFCAVFSNSPRNTYIDPRWYLDGEYACFASCSSETYELTLSDHVFLWYDSCSFEEVKEKIEEKKREAQRNSTSYNPLVQIDFTVCSFMKCCCEIGKIKECGVCPTSAVGYQDYIQQIQLPLPPNPDDHNAMEEPSRKSKFHSLDEFEEMIEF